MNKKNFTLEIQVLMKELNPSGNIESKSDSDEVNQELFKCKGNFYGHVEKNIFLFRIKILEFAKALLETDEIELN